jgi:hypothetical protein
MTPNTTDLHSPDAGATRRPPLVWVISGLYALAAMTALPTIVAATRGKLPLTTAAAAFYESFGMANYLGVFLSALLAALAAITLFRMKRSAFVFALSAFIVGVLKTILYWPSLRAMGRGTGYQGFTIVMGALIVLYVWRLRQKGRLG